MVPFFVPGLHPFRSPRTKEVAYMRWFLYGISLFWVAIGCCMILFTGETRHVFKNMIKTTGRKFLWFCSLHNRGAAFVCGIRKPLSRVYSIHRHSHGQEGRVYFLQPQDLCQKLTIWYLKQYRIRPAGFPVSLLLSLAPRYCPGLYDPPLRKDGALEKTG